MVTPAMGVSWASSTTVRPRKVVVMAMTCRVALADWEMDWPSMVAEAEIERVEVLLVCVAGAVRVRMAFWPTVMESGLKEDVTPAGRPLTARAARPLKPFVLATVTA